MTLGLVSALGAALCYGSASVLEAFASRRTAASVGLDPRLVVRLLRSWQYLLGLGLDGLAFLLSIVALRSLPLFVVQAVVASSLAVTAVLGALVLRMPLSRTDRIGIGVVITGLVLVGLSAAEDRPVGATPTEEWAVVVAALALVAVAVLAARSTGPTGAAVLGGVAGLAFGVVSIAARLLPAPMTVPGLLSSPATYGLAAAGALALLAYSTALQRGSVTQATAPLVVAETVVPSLVGVIWLGDRPQDGWTGVAVVGFCLAVAGAISLSRHGEVASGTTGGPAGETSTAPG